jgi:DNA-binding GntR family transcriptional regulator
VAGNQTLTETYRGIVQKLHLSRLKNLAHDTGMQASIAEHMDIVSALRQGDPERYHQLLSEHVDDAHNRLTKPMSLLS